MNTAQQGLKRAHVIEQLHKFNYTDTDGKTYRELVHKLSVLRVMNEGEVECDL